MLMGAGLKNVTINLTDMPTWKLKLLAHECVIRLNNLAWIIMYYFIFPLRTINPRIPELASRLAVKLKTLLGRGQLKSFTHDDEKDL